MLWPYLNLLPDYQQILDSDHSGVVELNDISAKYSADKHPDVIAGKRSKDDVLRYLQSV
jgi:hypothetical protein